MKNMLKNKIKRIGSLGILAAVFLVSCTDLEIKETDSIFTDSGDGFAGVADPAGSLTNLNNNVRGNLEGQEHLFALTEVSTDETFVPTRGTDWGDNGIWRVLHQHTWSPSHNYVLSTWNQWNQNVFNASEIIDSRSNPTAAQAAEARFLRAFSMFWIMDLYGQVPFREPDEGPEIEPKVLTRPEAYAFILNDLNEAISALPATGPNNDMTNFGHKSAARFLKARVLLNSGIYTGSGTPSAEALAEVITLVDEIAGDGFGLQAGYFDLFTESQDNETIWWVGASSGNRMWNGLHYNMGHPDNGGGGWNGFSTLAEFYDLFEGAPNSNFVGDGQEERRGWVPDATTANEDNLGFGYGMLIGQQYDKDGVAIKDRNGNPLAFTKELPGLVGNNEVTGIRTLKYSPANGAFVSHQIIFRYADAHLMKAEAMYRAGGDALGMVNELRALRGAQDLASLSDEIFLDERGRELYHEFVRRTDMVRLGQFTRDWEFKDPGSVGNADKNLFPIPSNALLSNTKLTQNPGY